MTDPTSFKEAGDVVWRFQKGYSITTPRLKEAREALDCAIAFLQGRGDNLTSVALILDRESISNILRARGE